MNYDDLMDGNGQEIYVDLYIIDAKNEWYDEQNKRIVYPKYLPSEDFNPFYSGNPLFKEYKKLFNVLYEKGYKIIIDPRLVNDETFFFTPCFNRQLYDSPKEYKREKYAKIKDILSEYGIFEPLSISFPVDEFPQNLPPLPLMLKNENENGGQEKFIIRTEKQLDVLRRFYYEINSYDRAQKIKRTRRLYPNHPDMEFDENGCSQYGININLLDYKKLFFESMRFQEFVETPTVYNTSLRVLFNCVGDILAASIKYAVTSECNYRLCNGLFDRYLSNPCGPYFIGSESIVSNTINGGNSILLGKDSYTDEEKIILLAHNINPDIPLVPDDVLNACLSVSKNCRSGIGALCGMDFIFDAKTHRWKYLEEHEFPMFFSYCEKHNIPYDSYADNFSYTQYSVDLLLRVKTLVSYMNKKHNKTYSFDK